MKKINYYDVFDTYNGKPHETWKIIVSLLNNKNSFNFTLDKIKVNEIVCDESKVMAENFNTFLCSIGRNLAPTNNSNTGYKTTINQFLTNRAYASIFLGPVDQADVVQAINSLNFSKLVGMMISR